MSITDQIKRGADTLHDSIDWGFDRSKWANASEIATCIRKQWYGKNMPDKAEDRGRGYANRGHNIERWAIECMVADNVPIRYALGDQVSLQDKAAKISATGDGILDYGDGVWTPIDVKSIDPRTNKKNLPKPHHVTQLKISMALINDQLKPKGTKMSKGLLIYIDASDYDDILEFEIDMDENILADQQKRAAKLLRTRKPEMLDREGKTRGGKECRTECDFKDVCGVTGDSADDRLLGSRKRANRSSGLDASAQQYMEIKDKIASDTAVLDEVKEAIKQELGKRKENKIVVGDIEVDLQQVAGRSSFDKKAAEKDGIDLSPYTKIGKPSERLTVKRV
jgi:hypothetical protein